MLLLLPSKDVEEKGEGKGGKDGTKRRRVPMIADMDAYSTSFGVHKKKNKCFCLIRRARQFYNDDEWLSIWCLQALS